MKRIYEGKRSLDCWWPDGYHVREHRIVDADITMLYGNVVTSVDRERLKITSMQRTTLEGTPHYQYALGNKDVYIDYLNSLKHVTWARAAINQEHLDIQFMLDKFDKSDCIMYSPVTCPLISRETYVDVFREEMKNALQMTDAGKEILKQG